MRILFFSSILSISLLFSQNSYELKDGSTINGTVLSETESEITIETNFGVITISKSDILAKIYKVELNAGDSIFGEKIFEDENIIRLKTNYGEVDLNKADIKSIIEKGKKLKEEQVQPLYYPQRPFGLASLLFGGYTMDKDSDFSLGEEQLIDLFFFPTGYTLEQGTLYLSGLSFGFGVTEKFQITTNWWGFFRGDMNLRPKYQLFETGNWEKQQALSVGAHYHTRWRPNKYEWKDGLIAGKEKYWGGFYPIGEDPEYKIIFEPEGYVNRLDNSENELVEMIEVFGAFTYSKAREGLRGRISHSAGGNLQYVNSEEPKTFYSAYYGVDVDINNRLKMIGSIFYDPSYIEFSDENYYNDYYEIGDLSDSPLVKEEIDPIHFDFGFMYALNESFRFGIHFQPYIFAFYWKF
jgi:hypothetical protein